MTVRVMKVTFRHMMFESGRPYPRSYVASVQLKEDPLERLYSEDQIIHGTNRPWAVSARRLILRR